MKILHAGSLFVAAWMLAIALGVAQAQTFGGAFDGMRDSDQPIQIEADRLEVTDDQGIAVFRGNVAVVQGTTVMKTASLRVYYSRDSQGRVGPGGNVRRIEASGGVAVRSEDQHATAESAVVDMQTEIATLNGNVAVSQGKNIITGCVVTVNMRTNNIDVKPCGDRGSGRVKVLIDRAPAPTQ